MKSDVIHVTNDGLGVKEARKQAERVAAFLSLEKKQALHLGLLTEEVMGMMLALTGQKEADFWIESQDNNVSLHLKSETAMNSEMRKKLLSMSSTGKNVAAKGVMGKIKDVFQRLLEPLDDTAIAASAYVQGSSSAAPNAFASVGVCLWSLGQYKASLKTGGAPNKDWDELEKSIVSKLADEVQIGIIDNQVEMIIFKSFC